MSAAARPARTGLRPNGPHSLYHLVRADVRERVRRYSFLVTLGFVVWLGYGVYTGDVAVKLDRYRGEFNSAWAGGTMTLVVTSFLSLAGFYLVKNAVERDRRTGVGEILATTPMSRPLYTLGKTLSNFVALALMMAVLLAWAVALLVLGGRRAALEPWPLLGPFVLVALPCLLFVAAVAVFCECVPGLRGGPGNVLYVLAWPLLLALPMMAPGAPDLAGLRLIGESMQAALSAVAPDYRGGFSLTLSPGEAAATRTFVWDGVHWTAAAVGQRLAIVGLALAVALAAALPFDRFDPARRRLAGRARRAASPAESGAVEAPAAAPAPTPHAAPGALTPARRRYGFAGAFAAELRLALKGLPRIWTIVALGLAIGGLAAPLPVARQYLLPLVWIWPLTLWSAMGTRERRFATEALLFSSPRPLAHQLPVVWAAGVAIAAAMGAGVALRLLLAGDAAALGAWAVAALFIPSLALALGTWSGGSKLFEALYTLLWYVGPMNRVPTLDFIGVTPQSAALGIPLHFLAAAAALLVLAGLGRAWRLRAG